MWSTHFGMCSTHVECALRGESIKMCTSWKNRPKRALCGQIAQSVHFVDKCALCGPVFSNGCVMCNFNVTHTKTALLENLSPLKGDIVESYVCK